MARVDVRGVIIPNDYKWFYEYLEEDSTCPRDIEKAIETLTPGEDLDVYVNSPGGEIASGSDIYTMLRSLPEGRVKIHITGEACSAASIISMAGWSEMSPTALMMVHCVSSGVSGNHTDMEHMAEVLRTADRALCTAYMAKANMTEEEALQMMEHETWMTAEQAKEAGLIDQIMFEEPIMDVPLVAGPLFRLPTKEQMDKARALMTAQDTPTEPVIDTAFEAEKIKASLNLRRLSARK